MSHGTIGILNAGALAPGVIGNAGDERLPDGFAASLLSAQGDVDFLEQSSVIEAWAVDALVRCGQEGYPVECIKCAATQEVFGDQGRALRPIGRLFVIGGELSRGLQGVTLEVVDICCCHACAVIMTEDLAG